MLSDAKEEIRLWPRKWGAFEMALNLATRRKLEWPLDQVLEKFLPVATYPPVKPGDVLPAAERMARIRIVLRLAGGDGDKIFIKYFLWHELGILAVPGAEYLIWRIGMSRQLGRGNVALDEWRARCKRKRRINPRFRRIALERARGHCVYCGRPELDEYLVIDHVRPVSCGGRSVLRNLVAACDRCNARKSDALGWEPYTFAWCLMVLQDSAPKSVTT